MLTKVAIIFALDVASIKLIAIYRRRIITAISVYKHKVMKGYYYEKIQFY